MTPHRLIAPLVLAVAAAGCARRTAPLVAPRASAVALSGGPGTSMAYLARTDSGVVVIDLGWWGGERALRRAFRDLGTDPAQVTDVFLTHSHRDHVGAWRVVRGARFTVGAGEETRLTRASFHEGWVPWLAEHVKPSDLPTAEEVRVRTFARDTAFVFGRDTLRAYTVPGHTAGSAVYLFRGTLFLGDAATYTPWGGFGPARRGYSDDVGEAKGNLARLLRRLPEGGVRYVCTAHAHCTEWSEGFVRDVRR